MGSPWSDIAPALGYERIPRFQPERIEGSGRSVMLDRPHDLAAAIERFVQHPDGELIAGRADH